MMQFIRGISAAQFAGIVLLFFLPFIEVACSPGNISPELQSGEFSIEITGKDLAIGGKPDLKTPGGGTAPSAPSTQTMPGTSPDKGVDMKTSALAAWILAAVGIVVSLMGGRAVRIGSAAIGFLGAVAMFWLKSEIDADFGRGIEQARGMIRLEYQFAFWACVVLFITAAATNAFAILRPPDGQD